ncbi:MAG: DUF4091 domain-containing protein [Lentisphaerae bacterium]|nr:DUF4091 domain-containing protein [Lentisphaerota bacterium]
MKVSMVDSLDWVYPDSKIPKKRCAKFQVDVARGGTASVTLLINNAIPGEPISLEVDSESGQKIDAKFYNLIDVPVERNTGPLRFTEKEGELNEFVTRRAPFRVYDAMQPVASSFEATSETHAVLVQIPVSTRAKPGLREYYITVGQAQRMTMLVLTVQIYSVTLPPIGRNSWHFTNWYSFTSMATRHGLKPWGEAHWRMIAKYAELMARNRQNTFWFSMGDVFKLTDKGLKLNRSRLRRIVKTFTDVGMYYIEGPLLGGRTTGEWACPTFSINITKNLATSPEGNADIATVGRQLMAEIRKHNWQDRWIQHVTDEPIKQNATDYRMFVGMVRKYMPGITIMDALLDTSLVGSVDIWCPQASDFQRNHEKFKAVRELGDKVWYYTCCTPGGPWLNRLLDMELLRPVLIGWGAELFELDGYLHWGLNHYTANQDPFNMSVIENWGGGQNALPPGDTHVVYPGADGPWSSMRFEAHREGAEDLELLRMLKKRSPGQASKLVKSVITGLDKYTTNLRVFRSARRKLLKALS